MHYNRFRYYDPATGRYVSADPMAPTGDLNRFAYGAGNPTGSIDPFGLELLYDPSKSPAERRAIEKSLNEMREYYRRNGIEDPFDAFDGPDKPDLNVAIQSGRFYYESSSNTLIFDPHSGLAVGAEEALDAVAGVMNPAECTLLTCSPFLVHPL